VDQDALAKLLAKKFVQQKLVKAMQTPTGEYRPVKTSYPDGDYIKWTMKDFRDHIAGTHTFGHYTCDMDGLTKLITFDIDLDKTGTWVQEPDLTVLDKFYTDEEFKAATVIHKSTPREDWHDRRHPARGWYKLQLRTLTEWLSGTAHKDFGFQVASAYSGNKGCHVYCFFPEPVQSSMAREMALLVLEATAERIGGTKYKFEKVKGNSTFKYSHPDPYSDFSNLSIEIYPKQDEPLGTKLGNLVRLPLGRNNKNPKDPCFFVDQAAPMKELKPHPDPVALLEGKLSPWVGGS